MTPVCRHALAHRHAFFEFWPPHLSLVVKCGNWRQSSALPATRKLSYGHERINGRPAAAKPAVRAGRVALVVQLEYEWSVGCASQQLSWQFMKSCVLSLASSFEHMYR